MYEVFRHQILLGKPKASPTKIFITVGQKNFYESRDTPLMHKVF